MRSRDSIYYLNDFVDIGIDTYAEAGIQYLLVLTPKEVLETVNILHFGLMHHITLNLKEMDTLLITDMKLN